MKRSAVFAVALLATLLGGCQSLQVMNFKAAEGSGDKEFKHAALQVFTQKDKNIPGYALSGAQKERAYALQSCLGVERTLHALGTKDGVSAAWIPLAPAFAGALVNIWGEHIAAKADVIKASAEAKYAVSLVASPNKFLSAEDFLKSCIVVDRTDAPGGQGNLGMTAILKPRRVDDHAFVLELFYLDLDKALAVTRRPDKADQEATVAMSIALAVKGLREDKSGSWILKPVSEGVLTVPGVAIDGAPVDCTEGACPASDLMAIPDVRQGLSLTVSLVETGDVGFDADLAKAEIKALTGAMGPAVKEAVSAGLSPGTD